MFVRSATVFTAVSLLLLGQLSTVSATTKVRDIEVKAFSDSSCNNAINVKYETVTSNPFFKSTEAGSGKSISFNTGDHNWPNSKSFGKIKFEGANVTGSSGSNVYWQVPQPDQDCRYVMMLPWPQNHKSKGETQQGDGYVAMNVANEKCMFTTFTNSETTMYWGQCCGDDCQHYALNSSELVGNKGPKKRELDLNAVAELRSEHEAQKRKEPEATTLRTVARREAPTSLPRNYLRPRQQATPENNQPISDTEGKYLTSYMQGHWDDPKYLKYLADYMNNLQWWNCKVGWTGDKYGAPGEQIAVGGSQPCGSQSAPCNFQTTKGETKGTTVTWSEDTTHSTTNGGSVGLNLGIGGHEGGPSAGITGTYEHSVTDSVTHSTGQQFSETTSFTVAATQQQQPGTTAMLSYFPNYDCFPHRLDCGGGWEFPLDTCSATDKGDWRIVYLG